MSFGQSYIGSAKDQTFTLLEAIGTHGKVQDIFDSSSQLTKMYNDPTLSTTEKVVHCTTEGSFLVARVGELTVKDSYIKPVINGIATVAHMGRTVLHSLNESTQEIAIRVGLSALAGGGETLASIGKISTNHWAAYSVLGLAMTTSGLAISFWRRRQRSTQTP